MNLWLYTFGAFLIGGGGTILILGILFVLEGLGVIK